MAAGVTDGACEVSNLVAFRTRVKRAAQQHVISSRVWLAVGNRDLVTAFTIGFLIEFSLWLLFYAAVASGPETIQEFIWLDRLQAPAASIGISI
jgi:hypothetical protein